MFILNQTSDKFTHTKSRIVTEALLWLVGLMTVGVMLRVICVVIYMANGINPMEIAKFGGDPTTYIGKATWKTILKLLIVAPVCEEVIFRLGLGFSRKAGGLWIAILPVVLAFYFWKCRTCSPESISNYHTPDSSIHTDNYHDAFSWRMCNNLCPR